MYLSQSRALASSNISGNTMERKGGIFSTLWGLTTKKVWRNKFRLAIGVAAICSISDGLENLGVDALDDFSGSFLKKLKPIDGGSLSGGLVLYKEGGEITAGFTYEPLIGKTRVEIIRQSPNGTIICSGTVGDGVDDYWIEELVRRENGTYDVLGGSNYVDNNLISLWNIGEDCKLINYELYSHIYGGATYGIINLGEEIRVVGELKMSMDGSETEVYYGILDETYGDLEDYRYKVGDMDTSRGKEIYIDEEGDVLIVAEGEGEEEEEEENGGIEKKCVLLWIGEENEAEYGYSIGGERKNMSCVGGGLGTNGRMLLGLTERNGTEVWIGEFDTSEEELEGVYRIEKEKEWRWGLEKLEVLERGISMGGKIKRENREGIWKLEIGGSYKEEGVYTGMKLKENGVGENRWVVIREGGCEKGTWDMKGRGNKSVIWMGGGATEG